MSDRPGAISGASGHPGATAPPSRREVLRIGSLGLMGLGLPGLLAARRVSAGEFTARADSCIVIFLNGGPSHLDMWDMKPDAPREIRGEFRAIPSSVPEVQVSEHLPRLSRLMHHATLVRSMRHSVNNSHAAAVYAALTGHDRGEQGGGARPTDHPPPGAVLSQALATGRSTFPYVVLPFKTKEGAGGPLQPGFLAGFIGSTYDPFWVLEDPSAPTFRVRNLTLPEGVSGGRMAGRGALLSRLDAAFRDRRVELVFDAMDDFQRRAFDLLTSPSARRAFEIDAEPPAVRDSYGRNIYGQSVLLARRLIEAGTRVVTVSWAPDANATWDTHGKNFEKLRNPLLPQLDAALGSLLEDLVQRGMLERTLVAVLGDFGRTPKINKNAGRDHWNSCYTVMLAGGGVKGGFVYGASDRHGAVPETDPTTPGDVIATIYSILGVDPHSLIYDQLQRPFEIVKHGRILDEILT